MGPPACYSRFKLPDNGLCDHIIIIPRDRFITAVPEKKRDFARRFPIIIDDSLDSVCREEPRIDSPFPPKLKSYNGAPKGIFRTF